MRDVEYLSAIHVIDMCKSIFAHVDYSLRAYAYHRDVQKKSRLNTYQSKDLEEDLNPQLACIVEGRGRVFIYHGDYVAFVDDEQTFITRMD